MQEQARLDRETAGIRAAEEAKVRRRKIGQVYLYRRNFIGGF
jgi:hypothetical protein